MNLDGYLTFEKTRASYWSLNLAKAKKTSDWDLQDQKGVFVENALFYAVRVQKLSLIKYLIEERSMSVVGWNKNEATLAHVAAVGSLDIFQFLHHAGAAMTSVDSQGVAPIHIALQARNEPIIFYLFPFIRLDRKCLVSAIEGHCPPSILAKLANFWDTPTPLHIALYHLNIPAVKIGLEKSEKWDNEDFFGSCLSGWRQDRSSRLKTVSLISTLLLQYGYLPQKRPLILSPTDAAEMDRLFQTHSISLITDLYPCMNVELGKYAAIQSSEFYFISDT